MIVDIFAFWPQKPIAKSPTSSFWTPNWIHMLRNILFFACYLKPLFGKSNAAVVICVITLLKSYFHYATLAATSFHYQSDLRGQHKNVCLRQPNLTDQFNQRPEMMPSLPKQVNVSGPFLFA